MLHKIFHRSFGHFATEHCGLIVATGLSQRVSQRVVLVQGHREIVNGMLIDHKRVDLVYGQWSVQYEKGRGYGQEDFGGARVNFDALIDVGDAQSGQCAPRHISLHGEERAPRIEPHRLEFEARIGVGNERVLLGSDATVRGRLGQRCELAEAEAVGETDGDQRIAKRDEHKRHEHGDENVDQSHVLDDGEPGVLGQTFACRFEVAQVRGEQVEGVEGKREANNEFEEEFIFGRRA